MGRATKEVFEEHLAACDEAMVRYPSSYQVCKVLAERFGVNPRTVRTWMKIVRERRRAEIAPIDREVARDQARARFDLVFAMAINKTAVVKNIDGSPVLDPATGKPITKPAADLQRALHAEREIVHLDGLAQPIRSEVKVEAEVAQMPDLSDAKVRAALENYLKMVAPGGDLSKVAGEQFKLSGDE